MLRILKLLEQGKVEVSVGGRTVTIELLRAKNKCSPKLLDPTRYRNVLCNVRMTVDGNSVIVELQVHHRLVYDYNHDSDAHTPYEFFR